VRRARGLGLALALGGAALLAACAGPPQSPGRVRPLVVDPGYLPAFAGQAARGGD
jgi:hypothetical protein